jgi:hypothetical protein
MDTSSEVHDGNQVSVEKMSSSGALSFRSSEHKQEAASSEEPPTPTSIQSSAPGAI